MRTRAVTLVAIASFVALVGLADCTEPVVVEEGVPGCSNHSDDDRDGNIDCDDIDCHASGVCEVTLETCSNRLDDDQNGRADCEDPLCIEGGFCAAFEADCNVATQGDCPTGMGCYRRNEQTLECRLAGPGGERAPCTQNADPLAPSDCAAGFDCWDHYCLQSCLHDGHCFRETTCVLGTLEGMPYGVCTLPCTPFDDVRPACPTNWRCYSGHEFGRRFDNWREDSIQPGGALWFCVYPGAEEGALQGTASLGDPCDEIPALTSLERICPTPLACAPDAMGEFRCRNLCVLLPPDGVVRIECPAGQDCAALYPADPRPLGPLNSVVLGVCLDR